jgi:pimeloyl-ACP methyl ester carboxylesterase
MIVGMVNIGGRRLFIHCEGEGSPTIIMENGQGIDPPPWNWSNFYMHLAEITRTCMYDRANWGKSDPAPKSRTAQDMVNDLYALLVNAQIPGPYVFAGHDIGGWIVRLYAGQYPEEVVGMILVDSIHPDIGLRMSMAYPTETSNEPSPMTKERYIWANYYDSSIIMPNDSEGWDLRTSAEQVRKVTSLGDVPLLVLTGDLVKYGDYTLIRAIQPMLYAIWSTSQRDLLPLSTDSQLIVIQGAGHFMWNDKPDEVVNEIRQFVQEARATQP